MAAKKIVPFPFENDQIHHSEKNETGSLPNKG